VKKEYHTRETNAVATENLDFEAILGLETDLERTLIKNEEFVRGLNWGVPRYGHPEGQIYKHIQEVFQNIELTQVDTETRRQLRMIALVHDTFKFKEHKGFPRNWAKHHSILARQFFEQYSTEQVLLDVIELHDEAYYSWRTTHLYHKPKKGEKRLNNLLDRVGDNLQLYYLFFKCDTRTGDKNQAPLIWFEENIKGIDVLDF
jgi:hypothetical protein